jgi:hypothetical protein
MHFSKASIAIALQLGLGCMQTPYSQYPYLPYPKLTSNRSH